MMKRRNGCVAILFLAGLLSAAVFLALGALPNARGFQEAARPSRTLLLDKGFDRPIRSIQNPRLIPLPSMDLEALEKTIDGVEPALNLALDREHTFIQLYGGAQKLMLRHVVDDVEPKYTVVKLSDQVLTFANPDSKQEDMTVRGEEMAQFAHRVEEELEVPFLYIQAPAKTDMLPLPDGLEDYADAEADQFLSILKEEELNTLDLRPAFRQAAEEGRSVEELFFRTDHHWTPAGAFLGYQSLCEKLRDDYGFTILKEITDPDYYNKYTFHNAFLGSQGKRVGSLYASADDIEIWSPVFNTSFSYEVPMADIHRTGPFVTSLLFPELLTDDDLYLSNPYAVYSGGDFLLARSVNLESPYAPRIVVLRDSFGCALTPFLSIICGEVMAMDPRNFSGDQDKMLEYLDWLAPDVVLVLNTTSSLRVDELYPYLPTSRAQALEARRLESEQ